MRNNRWIGVDLSDGSFRASFSDGTEVDESTFKSTRKCGCRVATAISASNLFVESVELPSSARGRIAAYLPGLLDVKLPLPVEDCLLACGAKGKSTAIAFAVTRVEYLRQINQFATLAGCSPENVSPAPLVLWHKAFKEGKRLFPSQSGALFHLHTSSSAWTLLAGEMLKEGMQSVLTVASGDLASISRNIKILLNRMGLNCGYLSISGGAVTPDLLSSLSDLVEGLNVTSVSNPLTFLAEALAEEGETGKASEGNFATGEFEHIASVNRRLHRSIAAAVGLLLLSSVFFASAVNFKLKTMASLASVDASFGQLANRLAARSMGRKGPASVRLASNEFNERIVKSVAASSAASPLDALGEIFTFLDVREGTISSLNLSNGIMTFVCQTSNEGNFAALKGLLEGSGYLVETRPYNGSNNAYEFSISCVEGM